MHPKLSTFLQGSSQALPIVFGYLPLGFAFGVLAVENSIPPIAAFAMSCLVYAGSAQFIAASIWGSAEPSFSLATSIIATTAVVNSRHILLSATLAPWLKGLSKKQQCAFGLELTDEAFALHSSLCQTADPARIFGLNTTAQAGWVGGTLLGLVSTSLLPDPKLFGLDYALPAMFLALLLPHCRMRLNLCLGILAAGLSISLTLLGTGRFNVILATITTATLGTWLVLREERKRPKKPKLPPR